MIELIQFRDKQVKIYPLFKKYGSAAGGSRAGQPIKKKRKRFFFFCNRKLCPIVRAHSKKRKTKVEKTAANAAECEEI